MRMKWVLLVATVAGLMSPAASAHELWLHSRPGSDHAVVRLTFGDAPDLGEAERVAEIANAKVWAGGKPLGVKRLPDGLEARLPATDLCRRQRIGRPRRRHPLRPILDHLPRRLFADARHRVQ